MLQSNVGSLWGIVEAAGRLSNRFLWSVSAGVALSELVRGSSLGGRLPEFRGRSVLLATKDQLTAALALIELDRVACRIILCPPDLSIKHLPSVIATGSVDALVSDGAAPNPEIPDVECFATCSPTIVPIDPQRREFCQTEWVLLTQAPLVCQRW